VSDEEEFFTDDKRAESLLGGLDDFELDEDDRRLLSGDIGAGDFGSTQANWPVVAVVGRPNVGKSALVNRILGRREAVVQDTPGVTRDRVSYPAEWNERFFTLMDTGGWEPDAKGLDQSVAVQAEVAIDLADVIILVVDSRVGVTATDERVVTLLRHSGVPVVVAANKVDDQGGEADASALWSLGLGEPWPVSALHGRGVADMLDHILTLMPETAKTASLNGPGPRRIALVGCEVDKAEVRLPEGAIRELGEFEVMIQLHAEVTASVAINIVAE
jgi:GTP-binding protein